MSSSERYLAVKVVMMPRDTNRYGTIFGGVILSYIDLAGSAGAHYEIRRSGWPDRQMVSVAMNRVEFHRPVFVGDLVSFWTETIRIGRTSITMHVTVEAERQGGDRATDRGRSDLRGGRHDRHGTPSGADSRQLTALPIRKGQVRRTTSAFRTQQAAA